jgi:hypothetical protein
MTTRFSQIYLERGHPTKDSTRFRNRLSAYFSQELFGRYNAPCKAAYEIETGDTVPWIGGSQYFQKIFEKAEIRDVLDAVTLTYRVLHKHQDKSATGKWREFVIRVLQEENLGYRLDTDCVVHFYVDEEFERNRAATLAAIELPQFGAVRSAFEDAYHHLNSERKDTKAAVRSIFEALEVLIKLAVPGTQRLNKNVCIQQLRSACLAVCGGDTVEQEVLADLFASLGYWVDAVHRYRHGQLAHEPVAPSEETAIFILSTGTTFLRQIANYASRIPLATPPSEPALR